MLIHGFAGTGTKHWILRMTEALLFNDDINVIVVDWGPGAAMPNYLQAVAHTRLMGRQIALLVGLLGTPTRLHLVGFSLGAHVAGYAGQYTKIWRITGEYFFGITVQRLAKKGLRARRGVVTVELGLVDLRGLASFLHTQVERPPNLTTGLVRGPVSGPLVVKVQNDYTARSTKHFSFVNPRITSIKPDMGPKSGGTHLRIWGLHMDAGSRAEAFVDGLECKVIGIRESCLKGEFWWYKLRVYVGELHQAGRVYRRQPNYVDCITSTSKETGPGKVRVKFDNGLRIFEDFNFLYMEDPMIHRVESGGGSSAHHRGVPKGIPSGGIAISVFGSNLNTVGHPRMVLMVEGEEFTSVSLSASSSHECRSDSATEMKCSSPAIPAYKLPFQGDDYIELDYGFVMDNVQKLRNLSSRLGFPKFQMYPDPVYYPFTEDNQVKYYRSEYLTINGRNLERASQESDVKVRIGTQYCNVTSLSRTQLTCRPPTRQPPARDPHGREDRSRIPQVVVEVGDKLRFTIGRLNYELPSSQETTLSKPAIIGVIVGGAILIITVIIILIAYRRKSTESSRVLKNMQEQMDVLELRVASECKEAFAELQTEITDLTGDMTSGGIPYLDYQSYAMKVLFPNADDHPVLREMQNYQVASLVCHQHGSDRRLWQQLDPIKKPYIEKGLRLFGQLIMNKTFLLIFIRTLESNRYFSMRDRVNVASLIMVTLQGKMEYCSDILKTLLAELIEKCIDGKSHPKLLLRRTESVAEKMLSAWFTFLLYKFLRRDEVSVADCRNVPGSPCSSSTVPSNNRWTRALWTPSPVRLATPFSEEKLIRQSIEYKCMTVYVAMSHQTAYMTGLEHPGENIETPVKVLDCDTVTQVKEKALDTIYRNTPFSQRPYKEDLDLEWRTGNTGRLTLSDEDATTKMDSEWKRLNSLAHYKVPDGALLTLVPKQSSMYNLSIMSEKADRHHHKYETLNFSLKASPPLSRATSPLHHHDHETGYRYWHLVKHHDAEHKEGDRGNKMVSEIYLTRLLATKYDVIYIKSDLPIAPPLYSTLFWARCRSLWTTCFETIFSTAHRGSALPLAIKYMFDFLDDQALYTASLTPEVVHTWKSNRTPNFVFDIHKTNIVDSCLSVVAQTFMDACSTSDHRLGKDSPSSKLLYAKDIPIYKDWVERSEYRQNPSSLESSCHLLAASTSALESSSWRKRINARTEGDGEEDDKGNCITVTLKLMSAISDQDMNAMLAEESRVSGPPTSMYPSPHVCLYSSNAHEFNTNVALYDLYSYAIKYNDQLIVALEEDEFSNKNKLAKKLEQVYSIMTGESEA
ncbi:PlexA [Cordylochernes scorpioides]|uniref:PlexA n=1 Tax=Cordylochernes scorpioides TaxID=51811 RepID=A0ABY6KPG7_9ARAC|nr:PlexA [Cordylochernes scorpioides]